MFPYGYTIRVSNKSKHLSLKITNRGLEVVLPHRMRTLPQTTILQFLEEKKRWIERYKDYLDFAKAAKKQILPTTIHLAGVSQDWDISYEHTNAKRLQLIPNANLQMTVLGDCNHIPSIYKTLRAWLKKMAEEHLVKALTLLANKHRFAVNSIRVRESRARWGSCSSSGDITLSSRCLLLPPSLMQHVLLHELCHIKYMNHGKQFQRLLLRYDENFTDHITQLKEAAFKLPLWCDQPITGEI